MLYSFAKILMTTGLRFFYRRIHVTGLENIPAKGPAIIIANHNSSLMDAALLGILLKRKAWFFARGDVFANKYVRKLLWQLHMMPVHSHVGGRNTLSANSDSFADGKKILAKGGIIVFFPESTSHTQHQLLSFRKGVFRLAFETAAAADFSYDIPIVPVGITYDHPVNSRTDVQVHVGQPLLLSAYLPSFKLNPAIAFLQLSKDAYQAVYQLTLHVTESDRLQTASHLLIINRSNYTEPNNNWIVSHRQKLDREKNICESVNETCATDFESNRLKADKYFTQLKAKDITDEAVCSKPSFSIFKKIGCWLGFPLYMVGLLLNGLPIAAARSIANKKVYRLDFYSWIFAATYSFMYLFWMLLLLSITCFFWGWHYALGLLALMIVSGLFAYKYKDWLKENRISNKWQSLSVGEQNELVAMRNNI